MSRLPEAAHLPAGVLRQLPSELLLGLPPQVLLRKQLQRPSRVAVHQPPVRRAGDAVAEPVCRAAGAETGLPCGDLRSTLSVSWGPRCWRVSSGSAICRFERLHTASKALIWSQARMAVIAEPLSLAVSNAVGCICGTGSGSTEAGLQPGVDLANVVRQAVQILRDAVKIGRHSKLVIILRSQRNSERHRCK